MCVCVEIIIQQYLYVLYLNTSQLPFKNDGGGAGGEG